MLIIKPRGVKRRYRYGGSGIIDTFGRQMFSSGLKKVLSSAVQSKAAHNLADAVVNGATSATKRAVETAVGDLGGVLVKKLTRVVEKPAKRVKYDIEQLINGSGIVLD